MATAIRNGTERSVIGIHSNHDQIGIVAIHCSGEVRHTTIAIENPSARRMEARIISSMTTAADCAAFIREQLPELLVFVRDAGNWCDSLVPCRIITQFRDAPSIEVSRPKLRLFSARDCNATDKRLAASLLSEFGIETDTPTSEALGAAWIGACLLKYITPAIERQKRILDEIGAEQF